MIVVDDDATIFIIFIICPHDPPPPPPLARDPHPPQPHTHHPHTHSHTHHCVLMKCRYVAGHPDVPRLPAHEARRFDLGAGERGGERFGVCSSVS